MVFEVEESILLALGVLALSETLGRGACARSVHWLGRAGWVVVCIALAIALDVAADGRRELLRVHIAFSVLASLVLHRARRGALESPTFVAANAGALLGAIPWLVASVIPDFGGDTLATYAAGLALVLLPFFPLGRTRSRLDQWAGRWWPVRRENVGDAMWHYVRPRNTLAAFGIALTGLALMDRGAVGRTTAAGVSICAGLVFLYLAYRATLRLAIPLREGLTWYRPRGRGSFVLVDAIAGCAIALAAIAAACEAIVLSQRLAADTALEQAAQEAAAQGMESTWAMSAEELGSAEGTRRTRVEPSVRLPDAEVERVVTRVEGDGLWRVRVTVRWKGPHGNERSLTLESLRSTAGGRR